MTEPEIGASRFASSPLTGTTKTEWPATFGPTTSNEPAAEPVASLGGGTSSTLAVIGLPAPVAAIDAISIVQPTSNAVSGRPSRQTTSTVKSESQGSSRRQMNGLRITGRPDGQ